VGQPQVNHCRLANPTFTTEEDELTLSGGGTREPLLQNLDFGLTPHDGLCSSWRDSAVILQEEPLIPLPPDGLQILRGFRRVL
jgi:hypothetical protein